MIKRIFTGVLAGIIVILCAGCNKKTENETGVENVVRWYMPITSTSETTKIHEKAQEYILEKTGIKTELIPVNVGDYEQKLQMVNASREVYDLSFVSSWMNFYNNNIRRGSLLDITELIKEYAPNTYKNVPEKFWEAAKYDGKLYGVINQQIMARGPVFSIAKRNDNLIKMDFSKYDNFIDAADEYLKLAYEYSGGPTKIGKIYQPIAYGFDEFLAEKAPAVINFNNDKNIKVFNQYESEEFKYAIKKIREWQLSGWIPATDEFKVDNKSFFAKTGENELYPNINVFPTYKPGIEAEQLSNNNIDLICKMIMPGVVSTYSVTSSLTGVSSTSKSPADALKVVEIMNNDKYLFNLVCYGIEGEHYNKLGENTIEQTDNRYVINNWAVGNTFNNYLWPNADENIWEDTKKLNEDSKMSPIAGFQINLEPIKVEFQNCNSVVAEYLPRFQGGYVDIETGYAEFISKLKAAGVDKLIEESQKQIDAWLEKK